ncbi:MAG TPA: hypothetical protein RMH85_04840 [Polyangiaceae bacterium LLY-WYZ-15_(1-7)]|nr:hypothetical protein [Polyangiaceae bacterium LLY-WYZ-15_(1-7)]HJL03666.1 hypothetical protein [Polyangiaceae bacterium LLY-WYZ-15_(1-7)]HJL07797.1 hypothetical protein [Polyangiaceae bacterium LLY-WYZ-15_(1-7)]HJL20959.1 hypothetical protein [Polyangiaceae bacterium LLY-WYZ-15_(1-7)]HJL30751.1 hypothetical protein [Polyangiaceae bacterium LLY-WYZ-15_(1-7)]
MPAAPSAKPRPARKKTEIGMPIAAPPLAEAEPAPDAGQGTPEKRPPSEPALTLDLPYADDSRITMDFSGPPLELPDDGSQTDLEAVEEGASDDPEGPLALDLSDFDEEEDDALGLVARSRPSQPEAEVALDHEMRERFALDDFTGALRVAELILGGDPEDAEAQRVATESRRRLEQFYTSQLGGLEAVHDVAMPESELRWLGLDHRAGFLLSRVDGAHSVEELVDVSGMPRLEALKTLAELLDLGAIRAR